MATVIVNWTLKSQSFPSGASPSTLGVQLLNSDGTNYSTTQTPAAGASSASFSGVSAGTYHAEVRRYAVGGAVLAASQTTFTVAAPVAPPVNVDVPDVVTVNVS